MKMITYDVMVFRMDDDNIYFMYDYLLLHFHVSTTIANSVLIIRYRSGKTDLTKQQLIEMELDDRIKERDAMIAAQARLLFDAKKHKQVINKHFLAVDLVREFHFCLLLLYHCYTIIITPVIYHHYHHGYYHSYHHNAL